MSGPEAWLTWRLLHTGVGFEPEGVAQQGLRTRSPAVLEALALSATQGRAGAAGLLSQVLAGALPDGPVSPQQARALAATAMVWAGSGRNTQELGAAALVFEHLWAVGAAEHLTDEHHLVAGQVLFLAQRHTQLEALLPDLDLLPAVVRHYLHTDLANPVTDHPAEAAPTREQAARWPVLLSQAFADSGWHRSPCWTTTTPASRCSTGCTRPATRPARPAERWSPWSCPCFQPDHGLLTSVRSISRQTWADLKILIVDDASGPAYRDLFQQAADLDPRARVITMDRNGGSYLAREAAIEASTGSLVTFQDADDWSHPSRIEHQVQALTDSTAPMSRSQAVRAKDDLTHQWLGYKPIRDNASSLLVRRTVLQDYGGFLPVRKGADSEFAERITTLAGPIADTHTPLAITRLRTGSLSRGDFTLSWFAPDRTMFRGAFQAWHRQLQHRARTAAPLGVSKSDLHAIPFPVPTTFVRDLDAAAHPTHLDLAYIGNFSTIAPSRHARDLRARLEHTPPTDQLLGIWHLEPPWTHSLLRPRMARAWFDLFQLHPCLRPLCRVEPVHVDHIVIVDPDVLSLVTGQPCTVRTDHVEVRLAPEHLDPDPSGLPLDLLGIAHLCAAWWGTRPHWTYAPSLTDHERHHVQTALPDLPVQETSSP